MIGPHVAPADVEAMTAFERRRDAALDADPEVVAKRAEYLRALDRYDEARRDLDGASLALAVETRRVLSEVR